MNMLFLAIDDISLPFRKNVGLYLTKPTVRQEPVLLPSPLGSGAPDDLAAHFYGTVLHDGGKFRMWYYACHWGKNPDWSPKMMQQVAKYEQETLFPGPLCYAESDDGIIWTKPSLGQVLFKGSRDNNALALPHTVVSGAIVIKDETDPEPMRRYKMTYQYFPDGADPVMDEYGTMPTIALAVSPDGLHWTMVGIPYKGQFVEPSSFIKHNGQYIVHYQVMDEFQGYRSEGGSACGRTGVARVSPDFSYWPDVQAEAFATTEPEDRSKRGYNGTYDQVHLGVGAVSLGNVCVGLYGMWHNADFNKAFSQISCDLGLLVSNDGIHFREPAKGHRFIRREDSLAIPVQGYDFNTVLCQANGVLNVGDETRIYHGRWRNTGGELEDGAAHVMKHYSAEVALATIPRDRWGALGLNPDANEGTIISAPITLPVRNGKLTLNAESAEGITVRILEENFHPIDEFGSGKCVVSDGLECQVEWSGHSLSDPMGRKVRFCLKMHRLGDASPWLYAINLHGHELPEGQRIRLDDLY